MIFYRHTNQIQIEEFCQIKKFSKWKDISITGFFYKGLPTYLNSSKVQSFQFIVVRVKEKLNYWSTTMISYARRSILIEVVLQAIPTYIMSSFPFMRNYWWDEDSNKKR